MPETTDERSTRRLKPSPIFCASVRAHMHAALPVNPSGSFQVWAAGEDQGFLHVNLPPLQKKRMRSAACRCVGIDDGGGRMKRESKFQGELVKEIKRRWPTAVVMKNDPNYIQGIPDLTVLYSDRWAMLECKRSRDEARQPNQEYYVSTMNGMSFARFVCPENVEDVLDEMEAHFGN